MGKGYNNFMSKKGFHPGSCSNQRKVTEAEEKAQAKKKQQEELHAQYQKEQELFNHKKLLNKGCADKLALNFMYEPPPGYKEVESKGKSTVWKASDATLKKELTHGDRIQLEWQREDVINSLPSDVGKSEIKVELKHEINAGMNREDPIQASLKNQVDSCVPSVKRKAQQDMMRQMLKKKKEQSQTNQDK